MTLTDKQKRQIVDCVANGIAVHHLMRECPALETTWNDDNHDDLATAVDKFVDELAQHMYDILEK